MVYVPAGDFIMGSSLLENEQPEHTVWLDGYWIDTYEVTNGLYRRCVEEGACPAHSLAGTRASDTYYGDPAYDNFPVDLVSWDDASQYCRWAGKHLPSEAQWEKAARGTDGRIFPWGNEWDPARVNSLLTNLYAPVAAGSYPDGASPYGAMEMAGNVWEWVADWYDEDYYSQSPRGNPTGPATGKAKIIRGGGYGVYDAAMRTTIRRDLFPLEEATYIGFRCAWSD
jgi:formylglycine-generating enzyme required for sulfatase activity